MTITFRQVNSANLDVQRDLYKSGFWYEDTRLNKATVYWTVLPSKETAGVFYHGTRWLDRIAGFREGLMFIRFISFQELLERTLPPSGLGELLRIEAFAAKSFR